MNTRLAIAFIGAVLAGGSLTANAGDGRDRDWDDHGSWGRDRDDDGPRHRGWGHSENHWHHPHWQPAPRWSPPGPAYRSYGGYPPPYVIREDGVTIIIQGRLY